MKKYKLSPSSADRFLTCTASVQYTSIFTENKYTLLGNLQHKVAQLRLEELFKNKDNAEKIDILTNYENFYRSDKNPELKVQWTKECENIVDDYVSYVKQLSEQLQPKDIFFEMWIKMKFHDNNIRGIADCVMVLQNNDVVIIDLKTGRKKVDIEDNNQMLLYAYGIIQETYNRIKEVPQNATIIIVQSIAYNTNALKYDLKQMIEWYTQQAKPMTEINTNNLVYRPNKKACVFCPFREKCNERIRKGVY